MLKLMRLFELPQVADIAESNNEVPQYMDLQFREASFPSLGSVSRNFN